MVVVRPNFGGIYGQLEDWSAAGCEAFGDVSITEQYNVCVYVYASRDKQLRPDLTVICVVRMTNTRKKRSRTEA